MLPIIFFIISFLPAFIFNPPVVQAEEISPVYVIRIQNAPITPPVAEYITNNIDRAALDGAAALVIELDTPGGLVSSTRTIVSKIMNSDIPIIVYISPSGSRAGSAGVFITLAAHTAAMAPSTNIGAAHPVGIGGGSSNRKALKKFVESINKKKPGKPDKSEKTEETAEEEDVMGQKILNDTAAWIRTIAHTRGRNEEWAEASVRKSVSVTEEEALDKGVIDLIAGDMEELLASLKLSSAKVVYLDMDWRERLLAVITNPNIAYILLMLGFYGLLFEFTHPGIGFPGVAGTIALVIAFYGLQTLPTNYAGIALIGLGIILFAAEMLIPGFGLPTLGGIVSMTLGSLILFPSSEEFMQVSLKVLAPFVLATAGITLFLVGAIIRSHRKKIGGGKEGLIGTEGKVIERLSPAEGKVFIHGEIWNAKCDGVIKEGEKVKVVRVEGMMLIVERTLGHCQISF